MRDAIATKTHKRLKKGCICVSLRLFTFPPSGLRGTERGRYHRSSRHDMPRADLPQNLCDLCTLCAFAFDSSAPLLALRLGAQPLAQRERGTGWRHHPLMGKGPGVRARGLPQWTRRTRRGTRRGVLSLRGRAAPEAILRQCSTCLSGSLSSTREIASPRGGQSRVLPLPLGSQ